MLRVDRMCRGTHGHLAARREQTGHCVDERRFYQWLVTLDVDNTFFLAKPQQGAGLREPVAAAEVINVRENGFKPVTLAGLHHRGIIRGDDDTLRT